MSDWGIKVSQEGYNITDPDRRLISSSSWKLLNIVDQGSFAGVPPGGLITPHDLGYVPMYWLTEDTGGGKARFSTFRSNITDTELRADGSNPGALAGSYIIFAVDLEEAYTAPISALGDTPDVSATRDKDFGIKIAKPGSDVSSTDMRDFTIHSGTRSPMLHQVSQPPIVDLGVTVSHDLDYAPIVFLYYRAESNPASPGYRIIGNPFEGILSSRVGDIVAGPFFDNGDVSVVLLKDPFRLN